jgi:hypothetical protein
MRIFILLFLLFVSGHFFDEDTNGKNQPYESFYLNWNEIRPGLEIARRKFPFTILAGDSFITFLRINPANAGLRLSCAKAKDGKSRTVKEWASDEGYDVVFNAGMYVPGPSLQARAFMKADTHVNQALRLPNYGGYFFLDAKKRGQAFRLSDRTCEEPSEFEKKFRSGFQCMRMVSCKGEAQSWDKKPQCCSMLAVGEDAAGNLVLAFTRSPMFHSEMAKILAGPELKLKTTLYMEGGPEVSVYYRSEGEEHVLLGTYVSKTYEKIDNQEMWALPNVVGIRFTNP